MKIRELARIGRKIGDGDGFAYQDLVLVYCEGQRHPYGLARTGVGEAVTRDLVNLSLDYEELAFLAGKAKDHAKPTRDPYVKCVCGHGYMDHRADGTWRCDKCACRNMRSPRKTLGREPEIDEVI